MPHDTLATLEQEILEKGICSELTSQATQLVMGEGDPNAEIVFIGEAPGKKEDETGRPFVGAAGKFLDEMLASVGIQRKDVYITNIVKYRPPKNRDPSSVEKAAFWPYLLRQLECINPTVVVTLGRHSMEYFLPDATIGEAHGMVFQITGTANDVSSHHWTLVPLYHPAAALYNGSLRPVLIDDFSKVAALTTSTNMLH